MKTLFSILVAITAISTATLVAAETITLESAPPVVVKTIPVAGATDVDPALTEIRVTYSKPMQDGSWSWSTWGKENFPEMVGQPRYLPDERTCVLTVKLEPAKFYAIWLNSDKFKNFKDTSGRPAVPYLLTFFTSGTPLGDASRYRLPNADAKTTAAGAASFSPVTETVLKSPDKRVAELLDLDTGERATSTKFGENDRETHAWIREHKLDLLGVIEQGHIGLLCMDMVVVNAPTNSFGKLTAQEVVTNWHLAQGEVNTISALTPLESKTDTFFFRTREGGRGILQILGENNDPSGVKIRYKLVQQPEGAETQKTIDAAGKPGGESVSGSTLAGSVRDDTRAVALFNDIENVIKGFEAAYKAKNLDTAKRNVRRLLTLLTNFNAVMKNPDYHFPAPLIDDLAKLYQALEEGNWEKARELEAQGDKEEHSFQFSVIAHHISELAKLERLNDDQRAVLEWTDHQFGSYFDARSFKGISIEERAELETRLLDQLKGPRNRDYYTAINSLAALRSTKAIEPLRAIAFDRADKNNRDRWMAIRALGIIGDKASVPELIHLVYHGNINTRWWAQISLVRLTGQNFGKDWNAWADWWNKENGQPPFKPEIIRWWSGQPEPDKLAETLDENDRNFLEKLRAPPGS